jgi:glycosyltransferase involved in cell wall biosynthesis
VLVPSRAEGLPLVLLEAWSMGRPVVASRVGGIPEAVEDGRNGVLLEAGDLPAWVATVRRLLADAPARHALGEAGRHTWQDRFTVEAMASRFEQVMAAALLPGQEKAR